MSKTKRGALMVGDRVRYETRFCGVGRGSGTMLFVTNARIVEVNGDRFELEGAKGQRFTGVHRARLTKLAPRNLDRGDAVPIDGSRPYRSPLALYREKRGEP